MLVLFFLTAWFFFSFQNLREHQLVGSSFLLAKFLFGFSMPFFPIDEYTGVLSQLLKNGMGTLLAFEI